MGSWHHLGVDETAFISELLKSSNAAQPGICRLSAQKIFHSGSEQFHALFDFQIVRAGSAETQGVYVALIDIKKFLRANELID